MTEADLEVLRNFEAVWERVMTGASAEPVPRWAAWEPLLQSVYEHWQNCQMMSRRTAGMEKYCLHRLAEETKEVFNHLQTDYFLETGDIFLTREMRNFASCTPYNLRKLWKNAIKLARDLQNAIDEDGTSFEKAAETIYRQADVLKDLIYQSLR